MEKRGYGNIDIDGTKASDSGIQRMTFLDMAEHSDIELASDLHMRRWHYSQNLMLTIGFYLVNQHQVNIIFRDMAG